MAKCCAKRFRCLVALSAAPTHKRNEKSRCWNKKKRQANSFCTLDNKNVVVSKARFTVIIGMNWKKKRSQLWSSNVWLTANKKYVHWHLAIELSRLYDREKKILTICIVSVSFTWFTTIHHTGGACRHICLCIRIEIARLTLFTLATLDWDNKEIAFPVVFAPTDYFRV